jgi:hypothetical protein
MNRSTAWFQVFLASLQALITQFGPQQPHQTMSAARAHADEAMMHLDPGVVEEPTTIHIPDLKGLTIEPAPAGRISNMQTIDDAGIIAIPTPAPAETEDDMEQARR